MRLELVRRKVPYRGGSFYCFLIFNQNQPMEHYCESLYLNLQKDIAACKQGELSCIKKVERCFRFAVGGWMELSKKLRHHHFDSEECEIRFFKTLKPKITAEIEYYNFVYHSVLFQPGEKDSVFRFWRREYERLERFKTGNQVFIRCYEDGQCEMQAHFFLRKNYHLENTTDARIYNADPSTSTHGDWVIATLLALEKYHCYAEKKLKSL